MTVTVTEGVPAEGAACSEWAQLGAGGYALELKQEDSLGGEAGTGVRAAERWRPGHGDLVNPKEMVVASSERLWDVEG